MLFMVTKKKKKKKDHPFPFYKSTFETDMLKDFNNFVFKLFEKQIQNVHIMSNQIK